LQDEHDQAIDCHPFKWDHWPFKEKYSGNTQQEKSEKTKKQGRNLLQTCFDKNKIDAPNCDNTNKKKNMGWFHKMLDESIYFIAF
jgi:hypothetical protein